MRIGIVAILAAMAACPTLSAARAQPDCANWNSEGFFATAGADDARACLLAGADPDARAEEMAPPRCTRPRCSAIPPRWRRCSKPEPTPTHGQTMAAPRCTMLRAARPP